MLRPLMVTPLMRSSFATTTGKGVQRIELDTQGEADALLNDMDAGKADVFLVDVAAGGSQTLLDLENDIGLISEAMDMGYRLYGGFGHES